MKHRTTGLLLLGLASCAAVLAALALRPSGPPTVYRYYASPLPLSEDIATLSSDGRCLSLGRDEDPDRARSATRDRWAVAVGPRIAVLGSGPAMLLRDRESGLTIRPGAIFIGRMAFLSPGFEDGWMRQSVAVRWPIERDCGEGLAIIASIERIVKHSR